MEKLNQSRLILSYINGLWPRISYSYNKLRPMFMGAGAGYLYPKLIEVTWKYLREESELLKQRLAEVDPKDEEACNLVAGRTASLLLIFILFLTMLALYEDLGDLILTLGGKISASGLKKRAIFLPKALSAVFPIIGTALQKIRRL